MAERADRARVYLLDIRCRLFLTIANASSCARSRLGENLQIPDAVAITLKRLLEKRWVERQGHGADASYRITEEGIAAKTAFISLTKRLP